MREKSSANECGACRFGLGIRSVSAEAKYGTGPSEVTTERRQQLVPPNDIALLCILAYAQRGNASISSIRAWRRSAYRNYRAPTFLERIPRKRSATTIFQSRVLG